MSDLTIEILKEIRDELRSHGAKLDRTNERLDQVVHEQIRHATAIVALEHGQRELEHAIVAELRQLNARLDNVLTGPVGSTVRDTAGRVEKLEERVDALEKRASSG